MNSVKLGTKGKAQPQEGAWDTNYKILRKLSQFILAFWNLGRALASAGLQELQKHLVHDTCLIFKGNIISIW